MGHFSFVFSDPGCDARVAISSQSECMISSCSENSHEVCVFLLGVVGCVGPFGFEERHTETDDMVYLEGGAFLMG